MEPFSALSVATAIIQFLDFTGKVVAGTYRIYTSEPGVRQDDTFSHVTESFRNVNAELRRSLACSDSTSLSQQDRDILRLGRACDDMGAQLLSILNKIHKPPSRRINESAKRSDQQSVGFMRGASEDGIIKQQTICASLRAALLTVWKQPKIDTLCRNLDIYRNQITLL